MNKVCFNLTAVLQVPSLLSESLEQASTVYDETNSNIPKMLRMVRYGKVFYFNKASLYSGKTIDTKQLSLGQLLPVYRSPLSRFFTQGGGTSVLRLQQLCFCVCHSTNRE